MSQDPKPRYNSAPWTAADRQPILPQSYSPDDYRVMWEKTGEALRRGVPLARINRQLGHQTGGLVNSRVEIAQLMAAHGNQQDLQELPTPGVAEGAANALTHGATLGLSGYGYGDQQRARQFAGAHPKLNIAANLVGGLLPGVAGGEVAMAPASLLGKATTGALVTGGMGALQGASDAPPGERGMGALIGGGLGTATGLLTMAGSPLWRRRMPGGRARIAEEAGVAMAREAGLAGEAVQQTQNELTQMQQALGAKSAVPFRQSTLAPGATMLTPNGGVTSTPATIPATAPVVAPTIADTRLGRSALEGVATKSGQAAGMASQALEARAVQMPGALEQLVAEASGGAPRASTAQATALARQARRATARTMYQPLEAVVVEGDKARQAAELVLDLQGSPSFRGLYRKAQAIAADRGHPMIRIPTGTGEMEAAVDAGLVPDFLSFQSLKSAYDDAVGAAFRRGEGEAGRALAQRRDQLAQGIRDLFGAQYDAANAAYRQATAVVDAPTLGRRLWSTATDPIDVAQWAQSAPPEALDAFKQAARDELRRRVLATPRAGNAVRRVFDAAGQLGRDKLALIFEPDELSRLDAATGAMRSMNQTAQAVVGNSRTAVRQELMNQMGLTAPGQVPVYRNRIIAKTIGAPMTAEYNNRVNIGAPWLAKGLLSTNPSEQQGLFNSLARSAVKKPISIWDALPLAVTGATQRSFTGQLLQSQR